MADIVATFFSAADTPLTSPANVPTIRIRRNDTGALVVTNDPMTEVGDGNYRYTFAPVDGIDYSIRADGDPTAVGQTVAGGRYAFGSLSGRTEAVERLTKYAEDAVWIDQTNGAVGTVVGVNGTFDNPVTTIADAKVIADAIGVRKYRFTGPTQFHNVEAAHTNWIYEFESVQRGDTMTFNNQVLTGAIFKRCTVTGTQQSGSCALDDCAVFGVTDFNGQAFQCQIFGPLGIGAGVTLIDCRGEDTFGKAVIDMAGASGDVLLQRFAGKLGIRNLTSAARKVECRFLEGDLEIEASNTNGTIVAAGLADAVDNGAAGVTRDLTGLLRPIDIAVMRGFRTRYVLDGGSNAADPTRPDLDSAGLLLVGRVRIFRTAAEATSATLGAADGADGEIDSIELTANNTGTPGRLRDMTQIGG